VKCFFTFSFDILLPVGSGPPKGREAMQVKWWWNLYLTSLPYRGWWATAGYMGLVLVYNAVGLMSNNVSLHVYTREFVLCTGSFMYICPNSLVDIYTGWSRSVQLVYHSPLICRRWSRVAGVFPFDSFPPNRYNHYKISSLACIYQNFLL